MWKHPFLQGTEQTETLEFPRASAEEPEIRCMSCAAQGEHTSVFLGRLPWQSRCAKCKSSWQAQQINRYHTEVVQMAEYLPWAKHLRKSFKVSVEEGQEYIPVWSWAASEPTSKFPPASATPSQFPPASPAETGKAEGKSEEGSSGGGPQVAAEKPKFIQIPRVDDPVANLREALRAQLYAQIDLETAYEAFEKEKVFPDKGPLVEAIRTFRDSENAVEEKLQRVEEYIDFSQAYITEAKEVLSQFSSGSALVENCFSAMRSKKASASNKCPPEVSAAASSTQPPEAPSLQSIIEQVQALDLSPEEAAQLRKALKKNS